MIVRKIIAVIFLVIIGVTIVTCAASTSRQRGSTGKKTGRKNLENILPIFTPFPCFGVIRRSLNPASSNKFTDNQILNTDNNKNSDIEKLKFSVKLRDNILYIFSYLLRGRDNGLTEEQYTSVQMLYDAIRKRMVRVYNILPALSKLDTTDRNQQTITILSSLVENLPPYLRCAANFLIQEIEENKFDLNILFTSTKVTTFNYLSNIDSSIFRNQPNFDEEMEADDEQSRITQNTLGSLFVGLLHNLHVNKLPLSQELFGLILINLPNPSDDPVLEENIRYLYDVTVNNYITNWNWIEKDVASKDAYSVVFSTLSKILAYPSTATVRNAAIYVYNHLKLVIPTHANPNFNYMYNLIKQGINIGMLLSAIVPEEFGPDAVRMKDQLLVYFTRNYKNKELDQALRGFNRFAFHDPSDLLMAFLTRLQNRIPASNVNVLQPVTALLSTLIMKKYARTFTPIMSPEVDILILLESVKSPDVNPVLSSMIDSLRLELISQPQLSVFLSTLMPVEKINCLMPRQCLINTFQQVERLQGNLPFMLIKKIQNVAYTLQSSSPVQYQPQYILPQGFDTQYPTVSTTQANAVVMVLEPDNVQTPNVPELGGSWYVWNIDNYIGETDHGVPDGSAGISESATPASIDSAETEVVTSITTERVQITENVLPSTETLLDKSTILTDAPQVSYTSTQVPQKVPIVNNKSTSIPPTQSPKKPETPQTEQPNYGTYTTTESSSKESSFEIEYEETPVPVSQIPLSVPQISISVPEEKKDVTHSTISESFESPKVTTEKIIVLPVNEPHTVTTTLEPSTLEASEPPTIEEKPQPAENVAIEIIFSPPIEPDLPLLIQILSNGVPVVTTDSHDMSMPKLVLPAIKELLKPPNIDNLFEGSNTRKVLQPLSATFGSDYIKKILKETDTNSYSTNIALLTAILKKAKNLPEVTENTDLINLIQKYIASIDFISPTILLPIITSVKKLTSNVIYSTFNQQDLTYSQISENPPDESSSDTVTVPLVNPKLLLQPVNPSNPYGDLLPVLEEGNTFEVTIRPLKAIFTSEKIVEIFGPDFQPLVYPNKGALLVTLLRKLRKTETIQSNSKLKSLIEMYLHAIEIPAMNSPVSEDDLVKIKFETISYWQPELPVDELHTVTTKSEPSSTIEEKLQPTENVATGITFPPSIEPDQLFQIQISSNGVLVVTTDDTSMPKLVLPGIKELLKPPNIDNLFEGNNTRKVLQPLSLSATFGSDYIKKILKEVDIKSYSTNVALLMAILKKAKSLPQVAENTDLRNLIQKYIASIDFISPTILLPIVISAKKLTSNVIYSTFNQQNLTHSEISENPPDESSSDTVTVPLVNPMLLLQPVNPSDPYGDLLPVLEEGDIFEVTLRPLRAIFTSEKIVEILGPDFQPLVYPNKSALLVTLLRKLRKTKTIQSNPELKSLIEMYLHAIEIPAMNSPVSEDDLVKINFETIGHWQPALHVDEPHTVTTRPEPSPTVEEKPQPAKNLATGIIFPPSVELDQPLQIEISSNGVPVVTTDDSDDISVPKLVLPAVKELLKPPNIDNLIEGSNTRKVLQPLSLSTTFGSDYIKKILKEVDIKSYSTNIALLTVILKKAKNLPEVTENTDLINLIQKYIASIDFISPTILLPIVTSAKKLTSNVIYSTFNQQDLTHSEISENPPDENSSDTVTVPLVNPKLLLQSVNLSDPYGDLLPILEKGDIFEMTLRPLRAIFTSEKIVEIFGPDFQPLVYPNKSALLVTLLRKLRKTETIQSNPELKSLIEMYLQAIEIPAMNNPVSEDNLVKMKSETTGYWQPELTSLIYVLPTVRNKTEIVKMKNIEHFLSDPNLLEKLQIDKPQSTMSRGELMQKIILNALSGKIRLKRQIVKALRYYKNKVQLNGIGALPIIWMWVEVYTIKAEVNLGNMIQNTLDFNKLDFEDKLAYNDLVTYLSMNPDLLQNNDDFDFENYKTQGQFIKALLKYLSKKILDDKIRKDIQQLLPHVSLTGPGATPIPSFFEF